MAKTAPKAKEETEVAPAQSKGELTTLQATRLPYLVQLGENMGIDRADWRVLVETIFPAAKSVEAVVMALNYCKRRGLDAFKRPVHIVPMWNSALRREVETIWPGIAELRTTAFRTGNYGGMDEPEFGETVEQVFEGRNNDNVRKAKVAYPEWCRITVYRMLNGHRHKFVGPKTYWLESYGRWRGTDAPNEMWAKRALGQLEKVAEAAALRRAFPEEIGNEYTAEEMHDTLVHDEEPKPDAEIQRERAKSTDDKLGKLADATAPKAAEPPHDEDGVIEDGEIVSEDPAPKASTTKKAAAKPAGGAKKEKAGKAAPEASQPAGEGGANAEADKNAPKSPDPRPEDAQYETFRAYFVETLKKCENPGHLVTLWKRDVLGYGAPREYLIPPDQADLEKLFADRKAELAGGGKK